MMAYISGNIIIADENKTQVNKTHTCVKGMFWRTTMLFLTMCSVVVKRHVARTRKHYILQPSYFPFVRFFTVNNTDIPPTYFTFWRFKLYVIIFRQKHNLISVCKYDF